VEARKVDVPYLILNINKLRTFLEPNLMCIEKGIKETYNWLKKI
jgi:hypothetical protein